jgi:hypothetical protein
LSSFLKFGSKTSPPCALLSYALKQDRKVNTDFARGLVAHLKSCAIGLVEPKTGSAATTQAQIASVRDAASARVAAKEKIDKSVLTLSEPKRIRSREHLRFVARQPCVICSRTPSQAHHVRYAQPRGLALKVSDEFTVPLCAIHHTEIHATGDERQWWLEHKIDPLPVAEQLWRRSNGIKQPTPARDDAHTTSERKEILKATA